MFHVIPLGYQMMPVDNCVYFARLRSGPIKIGTSCNPKARVRGIASSLPEPIELLGTLPGSYEREAYLHSVYADERIRGEFFAPSPRLEALIATLTETAS